MTATPSPQPAQSTAATAAPLPAAAQLLASGEFSETISGEPSVSFRLNGSGQSASYTLPITVADKRRTGAGWNLSITSTTFATDGTSPHVLPSTASRVTGASASCKAGSSCTNPVNQIAYPFFLPAGATPPAPVKLFDAKTGTGEGNFTVAPTISVTLPVNAYSGIYHTTITLALVSGPLRHGRAEVIRDHTGTHPQAKEERQWPTVSVRNPTRSPSPCAWRGELPRRSAERSGP